jgi:Protein of unknown function (DUF3300)
MEVKKRFKNMDISERAADFLRPRLGRQIFVSLLPFALLFAARPQNLSAQQDERDPAQAPQSQQYIQQSPEQLQQLVAPIALYPDSLVAQILASSTFPEQVVEADKWVQAHPGLKDEALGQAVDLQPWDPSVKALTAFPSVLGNMNKNLSWTSSLGDAYFNQEQDLMNAVQVMRRRAQEADNLKTTEQQTERPKTRPSSLSLLVPRSFTSPRMILGRFTAVRSWRGRSGIHTPESGMAARTSRSGAASESATTEDMDGAGIIGDAIGITEP